MSVQEIADNAAAPVKPACPDHPGETAHNCRCCAADRKAAPAEEIA